MSVLSIVDGSIFQVGVFNQPGHTRFHMVEIVAVEKPFATVLCLDPGYLLAHGWNINGVFTWIVVAIASIKNEPVAMYMDWVVHHGLVN